ncbi:MAG TPA: sigma-70 family RNA polymerase sigma factor [Amycolatopsis sp.]|nr:sigma-70 family RNA polymerase sigma factor [Amycolatopsis sp.]
MNPGTTAASPRSPHCGLSPEAIWALAEQAASGDKDAFSVLYQSHFNVVHGYLRSRAGNWSLAEDLTSETFARALASVNRLSHRRSTFAAWLITIARNLLVDNAKSARARCEVTIPDIWDAPADNAVDPVADFERNQNVELVRRCLRELIPSQRECLVLRYFLGYSVEQVAGIMHRTNAAVRVLQLRALRRLALLLATEPALNFP